MGKEKERGMGKIGENKNKGNSFWHPQVKHLEPWEEAWWMWSMADKASIRLTVCFTRFWVDRTHTKIKIT